MSYKIGWEARQYKKERDLYKRHALAMAKAIRRINKSWGKQGITAPIANAVDAMNSFEVDNQQPKP